MLAQDQVNLKVHHVMIHHHLTCYHESGILSFFAIQAGARRVYAIEASSIVKQCQVCAVSVHVVMHSTLSDHLPGTGQGK